MKASVAYKTLDNITVVMLAFKNFKHALSDEFVAINNPGSGTESKSTTISIEIMYLNLYRSSRTSKQREWPSRLGKRTRPGEEPGISRLFSRKSFVACSFRTRSECSSRQL